MKYIYLSFPISEGMPVYGGRAKMGLKATRAISKGDSVNAYRFSMESHWGTHIDAPRHFFNNGKSIKDYPPCTWVFKSPQVINLSLKPSEIVKVGKWIKKIKPSNDIIVFRSGWSRFRKDKKYIYQNPGMHPEIGTCLREAYPNVRAVGIDWISVSSGKDKPLGREAHRAFLDPEGKGNPLLVIEDMRLPVKLPGFESIFILPFVVLGIDSAPCTVLGAHCD